MYNVVVYKYQHQIVFVIEEDRSGYQQLPARTIGDTSLISHCTKINNQFTDNIFEPALIDTAVDHSSCDFNNNAKNGNDASPCRCMYIDTTDIYTVNSNFDKCKVADYGGTIHGLNDSTLSTRSSDENDNNNEDDNKEEKKAHNPFENVEKTNDNEKEKEKKKGGSQRSYNEWTTE